jgi:hypothetical protein
MKCTNSQGPWQLKQPHGRAVCSRTTLHRSAMRAILPAMIDEAPIYIKRYPGQRLYDPAAGRYISADTLRQWRDQNVDFCVLDVRTGEDVTGEVVRTTLVEASRLLH